MEEYKITFSNNDIITIDETTIFHCVKMNIDETDFLDGKAVFTGSLESDNVCCTDGIRALASIIANCDWFYLNNNQDTAYKSTSVVRIEH